MRIHRYGAYGVIVQNKQLLLILKKSGPYKGLWDLPGGGIEFGETPEETLRREFLEETALEVDGSLKLLTVATAVGAYTRDQERVEYHHVGIIYGVATARSKAGIVPEEKERWVLPQAINPEELTLFAKQALQFT